MINFPNNPGIGDAFTLGGTIYTCVLIDPIVWNAAPAAAGIADAPTDGKTYGRNTAVWKALDKTDVGLDQVDNTADHNKPVSGPQGVALEPKIVAGTAAQYWRGDKTWQPLNAAAAGAEPPIVAGGITQFWRGDKTWQVLNPGNVGLGNVGNYAAVNKAGDTMSGALAVSGNLTANGGFFVTGNGTNVSFGSGGSGDWCWLWNSASGDLNWHRYAGQQDAVFQAGGGFISGGHLFTGNGGGIALMNDMVNPTLRYTADNWRQWWNGGNWFWSGANNQNYYTFGGDGNAQKYAGPTTWTVTSDARLKEEVLDYNVGLEAVLSLRPRIYKLKPYNNGIKTYSGTQIGFIADEAEEAMPELVTRAPGQLRDGTEVEDLAHMNIDPMLYAMVNAIKTLDARLKALEA